MTTIPAAAYIGAAIAMGRDDPMMGALGVLVTNVVTLIAASALTLMFERRRQRKVMLVPAVSSDGATG